jgi:hypothetical protein
MLLCNVPQEVLEHAWTVDQGGAAARTSLLRSALAIAVEHRLSAYDAQHIALALQEE